MKEKIRQWFVDNPRAMNAAYVVLAGSVTLVTTLDSAGAQTGP